MRSQPTRSLGIVGLVVVSVWAVPAFAADDPDIGSPAPSTAPAGQPHGIISSPPDLGPYSREPIPADTAPAPTDPSSSTPNADGSSEAQRRKSSSRRCRAEARKTQATRKSHKTKRTARGKGRRGCKHLAKPR